MPSSIAEMISALRADPGSPELRELLADALEEQGDPRGELLRLGFAGPPAPEALEDVLGMAPGGGRIRFDRGLLVELEPESPVDTGWLASHPLLMVVIGLPWRPEELEQALTRWTPVLEAVDSVRITGSLGESLPRVLEWLAGFELERLWITPSSSATLAQPIPLPTVRNLALGGGSSDVLSVLLQGTPAVEHLRLRGTEDLPGLAGLPHLQCLDVRGLAMSPSTRQSLEKATIEVVHADFAHYPSAYDPFGLQGWMHAEPTRARATEAPLPRPMEPQADRPPDFGIARDGVLYTYDDDDPMERRAFTGTLPERSRRCRGTLARTEGTRVHWGEHTWDLGEPIRGVVASASHLWAVAGRQVWQLHPRTTVVGSCEHAAPVLSACGAVLAWTPSGNSVEIFTDPGDHQHAAYPDRYQGSQEPLRVADLLVLQGRLLVVLEHGGANLLQLGTRQANKLDPFPREQDRRWVFVWNGSILVAD